MSVTLTNRDSATEVFNLSSAQADGITLASTSSTSIDTRILKQRFQRTGTKKPRANVNYVRTKYDATSGVTGKLVMDITISVENPEVWSADEIDDTATAVPSIFASEADAMNLLSGLPRS